MPFSSIPCLERRFGDKKYRRNENPSNHTSTEPQRPTLSLRWKSEYEICEFSTVWPLRPKNAPKRRATRGKNVIGHISRTNRRISKCKGSIFIPGTRRSQPRRRRRAPIIRFHFRRRKPFYPRQSREAAVSTRLYPRQSREAAVSTRRKFHLQHQQSWCLRGLSLQPRSPAHGRNLGAGTHTCTIR